MTNTVNEFVQTQTEQISKSDFITKDVYDFIKKYNVETLEKEIDEIKDEMIELYEWIEELTDENGSLIYEEDEDKLDEWQNHYDSLEEDKEFKEELIEIINNPFPYKDVWVHPNGGLMIEFKD